LLIHTANLALAQGVALRYNLPGGGDVDAGLLSCTSYKDMVYAVFTPPAAQQFAFQQIRVPNNVQVEIFTNLAMLEESPVRYALLGGWHHTQFPNRTTPLPAGRKVLHVTPPAQRVYDGQWVPIYYMPFQNEALTMRVKVYYKGGAIYHSDVAKGNVFRYQPVLLPFSVEPSGLPGYAPGKEK
ncbi:hypothetical protein, partial [Amycolatopsis magusensis]